MYYRCFFIHTLNNELQWHIAGGGGWKGKSHMRKGPCNFKAVRRAHRNSGHLHLHYDTNTCDFHW